MDRKMVLYWASMLARASKGSEEAQEIIRTENEIRLESGQPTIEQEIMAIAEKLK